MNAKKYQLVVNGIDGAVYADEKSMLDAAFTLRNSAKTVNYRAIQPAGYRSRGLTALYESGNSVTVSVMLADGTYIKTLSRQDCIDRGLAIASCTQAHHADTAVIDESALSTDELRDALDDRFKNLAAKKLTAVIDAKIQRGRP